MIITKLQGGLGNQLFQWAAAYSYSIDHKCDLKVDTSFYFHQTLRKVELQNFTNINIATHNDINKTLIEFSDNFSYLDIPYDEDKIVYLNGFWQCEKYFNKNKSSIKTELSKNWISKFPLYKSIIGENAVSLHIRRTDYVHSNGYHPVQPIDYYKNAIELIGDYNKIFVFSDDIEWCIENLKFRDVIFVKDTTHIDDLWMMSLCKNNIIANSSFSWWGAWLNDNIDKKVIAPSNWFGEMANIESKDIIPDSWIKI